MFFDIIMYFLFLNYSFPKGIQEYCLENSPILFKVTSCCIFFLTFSGPCIANIFTEYNQRYPTFHNLFISVRRSTCFRRVFSVHRQELKTAHTASGTVFVRPKLLPAASLARLVAGSSIGLTST